MRQRFHNPMYVPPMYFWDTSEGVRLQLPDRKKLYRLALERDPEGTPEPFEEFEEVMQDRMCREMPDSLCTGAGEEHPSRSVTKAQLKRFFETLYHVGRAKVTGEPTHTDQREAERRAVICSVCPKNTPISCMGCSGFALTAHWYLQGRTTLKNDELQACAVCGCYLRAKIYLPEDIVVKLYPELEFPEKCWVTYARQRR